ncbi:hypothetical protein OAA09_00250 [bacterium]|nr:hypothetical protein [bacterium]
MSNPKDFLARQIRTNTLILSGGNWAKDGKGGTPGLLIYTASLAPDFIGTRPDKFRSGSSKHGMVQIIQSEMTPSGGFAIQDVFGGNVRISLEEPITPGTISTRRHTANLMLGTLTDVAGAASSSVASNVITMVTGGVGGKTGTTPRVFILSQSINGESNTKTDNAANNPLRMLDVNFFVSGSKGSKVSSGPGATGNGDCGVALFGGDVVISGTLYAEKQVIEVDISQSGSLYVSGSAEIGGGLIVNEHGGSEAVEWRNRDSNNFLYYGPALGGGDGYIGMGNMNWSAANPPLASVHIGDEGSGTNSAQTVLVVDYESTGTPADGLGARVMLRTENDANALQSAVLLEGILSDVSDGSEDAAFIIKTMTGGSGATEKLRIGSTETVVNESNLDHDFRVEGNSASATHLLHVDASTDDVVIRGPSSDDTVVFKVQGNSDTNSNNADLISIFPTESVFNDDAQTVDFRVEGKNNTHAIFVNSEVVSGFDQVLIMSATHGGDNGAVATDGNFIVSGSIGKRGVGNTYGTAIFGGDIHLSGNLTAGGSIGSWVDGGSHVYLIQNEHIVVGGTTIAAADIILANTGSATFNNQSSASGDFRVKSQNDESVLFIDASVDAVGVGTHIPDTSAKLHIGNSGNTSNQNALLLIENENASIADAFITFAKAGTAKHSIGMDDSSADRLRIALGDTLGASNKALMDFPSSLPNPIVINDDGQDMDFRIEGENDSSLFHLDASHDSIGINVAAGSHGARLDILANDAAEVGLLITNNPGSALLSGDIITLVSGSSEVFSVGGTAGDVVINEAGASRDFRVETSGDDKALLIDGTNDVVVINEDGNGVDFRVETAAEDEAFFIDASADTIYINKGETAVTTIIGSDNDEAIRVSSSGVTFNEDGHATNDFRVESDTKDHAVWVDSGQNFVGILTGSEVIDITATGGTKAGSDVCFFVSGSNDKGTAVRGVSAFGGDVVVSGTLYDGSGNNITTSYGQMSVLDSGGSVEGTSTAASAFDTFKLKEGTGIGLSIAAGSDQVTISANIGTASPAFTDRGFQTGHVENHRGTSIICTSSISFVSGNHIDGVSPVAYDASNAGQDVFFFVSGSVGGRSAAAAHRHGVSLFGGDLVVSGALNVRNTLSVSGNTSLKGNTSLGNATSDTITFTGRVNSHVLPSADSTYNLGSAALRFANIYTGDLHLRNDRGNWTIYEEPDMLVVVNNLTGKKYKMGLTPLEDEE